MPASCTVCDSGLRALVESGALQGKTPTTIARELNGKLTASSIRRHLEAHHKMPSYSTKRDPDESIADVVTGLWALYESAESIRKSAAEAGNGTLSLKANREAQLALSQLTKELGVTEKSVVEKLYRSKWFSRIIRIAAESSGVVAEALALAADPVDREYAALVRTYSPSQKENSNAH